MSSEHWEEVGTYLSIDRENGESGTRNQVQADG
jgi:hypothetical protein